EIAIPQAVEARLSPEGITARLGGLALHVAIIGLTVAWVVPTAGLLVSSFRSLADIQASGWWTALAPPFKFTLDNYSHVVQTNDLGTAFLNSIMISVPATGIPTTLAAFAPYACPWLTVSG